MNRKFGVYFLILCFGFSNINAALATEVLDIPPVIVQPYEAQESNRQMVDRSRQNQDEENAIKGLIEENDKLTQTTLASQEDEGLAKVNQTMLSYRSALASRDRALVNGQQPWTSRYGDLIALTEDADAVTVHQDLVSTSDLLAQKYQTLTELRDEMAALNEKLKVRSDGTNNPNELAAVEGFKKISRQQEDKIEMLTQRLGEMDQRIAKFDEIIAQKDRQIALLKDNLSVAQNETATKDEIIKGQKNQIDILEKTANVQTAPAGTNTVLPPIIVSSTAPLQQPTAQIESLLAAKNELIKEKQAQLDLLKSELENKIIELKDQGQKDAVIKQQEDQIAKLRAEQQDLSNKEELIRQQEDQIAHLKGQQQGLSDKDELIRQQEDQIANLKKAQRGLSDKDELIRQQERQISALKAEEQKVAAKDGLIKSQADQLARAIEQFKDQGAIYASVQTQMMALRNKLRSQTIDLKSKDETIRWLNKLLAVTKDKASYYQLTTKQDRLTTLQVREEVKNIKDDFARHLKDYDQIENTLVSLKDQTDQLGLQLTQKQKQVDSLKSRLEYYTNKEKQDAQIEQDLKDKLRDKENQIFKLKSDVLSILQAQANKEIYRRATAARMDDRVRLAKQLIDLQNQELALLEKKNALNADQNAVNKQHVLELQSRLEVLSNDLVQKNQQASLLRSELRNKIARQKDQSVLISQIEDLKAQVQDNENQIAAMKARVLEAQEKQEDIGSLKQQLAAQQDKEAQLKRQLDGKIAESSQMTSLMGDYQNKLESKDNAYNAQLGQVLALKNGQAQMEKQIAYLNTESREKEAQVVKIKRDMHELQEMNNAKAMDIQSKDLSLSMIQQKMMDEKIDEYQGKINGLQAISQNQLQEITSLKTGLGLAREQLQGMPSTDEIDFLRTGLNKATTELKQKDATLLQIKANADEYSKEFKEQTQEFESLKDQLLEAQNQIQRKDEDLKYKDMAIARLKMQSRTGTSQLQAQVLALTQQLQAAQKRSMVRAHENNVEALETQLRNADAQINDLDAQLKLLKNPAVSPNDIAGLKLKQALDKIDQQGRLINILAQKLQETGQSVDLTKDAGK